ncbi:MAG TPA: undecaprenyldiphospho-muramoylpentapeptide beta-N-acetylglucosaminyltransferase [Pseudogracilibacillus sp.]|nr:undecaprenyldiphospho-muramoylpentapeptide beta-N-acetylglucosaminyltransferase [Pseudogracilibacillus sp.]
MESKRILFTGGGTAGHVMVNLALIPYFQEQGWKVDYIGSKSGIEKDLIQDFPEVTYYPVSTGKLRRYMSLENVKDPFKVLKGTWEAWRIIGKTKPNVIFSKGGFVSVPVVAAAKLRRVPSLIHESDMTPGLANKLSIPFAKKVLATFPETTKHLPEKKAVYVGAVVRKALFNGDKERGKKMIDYQNKDDKQVLLIMGGSIGSQKINEQIRKNLPTLLEDFHIVHICGKGNVDEDVKQDGYVQFEYINDGLQDIFAATDLVISRAGANAIFEFLALNIPMLLIPLSRAASRGDQIDNAVSFEEKGYAHMLEEEQLEEKFHKKTADLVKNSPVMRDKMKQYKSGEARNKVIQLIEEMAK